MQLFVRGGDLTAGHVRTLLTVKNPEELAQRILSEGLSVRDAEKISRDASGKTKNPRKTAQKSTAAAPKDADTLALEKTVTNALGLKVEVEHGGDAGGYVKISYKTLEQLDDICDRLRKTPLASKGF